MHPKWLIYASDAGYNFVEQNGGAHMDRSITAGIYRIRPTRGNRVPPVSAFTAFDPDGVEIEVLDAFVRMHRVSARNNIWKGEFLRRQVDNFPPRARRRGEVLPLRLGDGEGLGHGAAFEFHANNNILVWQQVRTGASLTRFAAYLGQLANTSYAIEPVISVDALAELNHAQAKRIHVKIADPDNLQALDARQRDVKSAFRLFGQVADGAYVEVTIGSERGSNSFLPARKMRDFLRWLSQEADAERGGIQKLQIVGRTTDDDDLRVIDLLQGRMRDQTVLDIDGDNLERNFHRRSAWLSSVYEKFSEEIQQLYSEE